MIQAVLTERPVHAPMHGKDVIIRFDADEGGLSNKPRRIRRPWNLNSELTLSDGSRRAEGELRELCQGTTDTLPLSPDSMPRPSMTIAFSNTDW